MAVQTGLIGALPLILMMVGSALSQVTSQNYNCRYTSSVMSVPEYFLPFGDQAGDSQLPARDNAWVKVKMNTGFPYFRRIFKSLYVNSDGVVSFDSSFPTITPSRLPLSGKANLPMFAPYWADVDTSANNGRVYYRQTTDNYNRQLAADLILQHMNDYKTTMQSYSPSWVFVVTWHNVTFRGGSCTTPVNTFQLVMSTNGRHSFVSYLYGDMTWTTGRTDGGNSVGLGGTPALVGYASGTRSNNYYLPSSLTTAIRDVKTIQSNTIVRGMWNFRVENNAIHDWGCNTQGSLTILEGAGPALGGKPFFLSGPCFHGYNVMKCKIGNSTVSGSNLPNGVRCIPPTSFVNEEVPVLLSIDNGATYPFNTTYFYGYDDPKYTVKQVDLESWEVATTKGDIEWDTSVLDAATVSVEFVVILPSSTGGVTMSPVLIARGDTRQNPGKLELPLGLPLINKMPTLTSYGPLRVFDYYKTDSNTRTTLYNKPQWSLWFFNQYLIELIYRKNGNRAIEMTSEADGIWNNIRQFVQNVNPTRESVANFLAGGGLDSWITNFFTTFCNSWADGERRSPTRFTTLKPVPCTESQASRDFDFVPDSNCRKGYGCYYRPDAQYCALDKTPSSKGHGQRACYDRSGNLIKRGGTVSAGTAQKFFQSNWFMNAFFDTRGHAHCCRFSSNCNTYSRYRPTGNCAGYSQGGARTTVGPASDLKLSPNKGPMLGGNQVIVDLPTRQLSSSNQVKCYFGDKSVPGVVRGNNQVKCIAPLSPTLGSVQVRVSSDNGYTKLPYSAYYTFVMKDPPNEVILENQERWEIASHKGVITWNSSALNAPFVRVEFDIIFPASFDPSTTKTGAMTQETVILSNVDARRTPGRTTLPLGFPLINKMPTLTTYGPLRVFDMYKDQQPDTRITLWSQPQWSLWFFNQYLIELTYRKRANVQIEMTSEANGIWNQMGRYVQNVSPRREDIADFIARGGLDAWIKTYYTGWCNNWVNGEIKSPVDFPSLSPVPCTSSQAEADTSFLPDPNCASGRGCLFRPQAKTCYASRVPSSKDHGDRSCYDDSGNLIKTGGTASSGTAQRFFPTDWLNNAFFDGRGLAHCCRFSPNCNKYARYRPTGNCAGYSSSGQGPSPQPTDPTITLTAVPQSGPVLGGNPVVLTVPQPFSSSGNLACRFGDTMVPAVVIQNTQVQCIAPLTNKVEKTDITLFLGDGKTYQAPYVYVFKDPLYTLEKVDDLAWDRATSEVVVRWKDFTPNRINVDFVAYMPALVSDAPPNHLITPILIEKDVSSTPGEVKLPIGLANIAEMPLATTFGAIRIYDSSQTKESTRVALYTVPFWSLWFLHQYLIELTYRKRSNTNIQMTAEADDFWAGMEPYVRNVRPTRRAIAQFIQDGGLATFLVDRFTNTYCNNWYKGDKANPADFSDLPAAPCNMTEAEKDGRYVIDPSCNTLSGCPYRTNASQCFLLAQPTVRKHGQRVCYDLKGQLITLGGTVSAGAAQRYFPSSWFLNLFQDTRGHDHCCEFGNACYRYTEQRPTNTCTGYIFEAAGAGGNELSLASLIGMLLAGASCGIIVAVIIVGFGLPSNKAKKKKSGTVSQQKPQKRKKKEKERKIKRPKHVHRNTVTSYPENDYVEPMYPPQPAATDRNRNRNLRDSDYRRSDTSATEYTDIHDSYSDKRTSRLSSQLASQETMYTDPSSRYPRNNGKRDSQISEPASVRSSNSRRSNNSRQSQQPYTHERRISEESGESARQYGSNHYGRNSEISGSGRRSPSPHNGYGHPAGSTNIMF